MQDPWLFALTVLTILVVPGPTNTLLATAGAAAGVRRSLPLVAAEACGYIIAILAYGLVLAPVVARLPSLRPALQVAVGCYLLLLAVRLWRHGAASGPVAAITVRQVFVVTLLNPKAAVFALGVIPFSAPHPERYLAGFVALMTVVSVGWLTAGAVLGRAASAAGRDRIVPRMGAAAVACFATLLVASPFLR